jgi:hypothetical protein
MLICERPFKFSSRGIYASSLSLSLSLFSPLNSLLLHSTLYLTLISPLFAFNSRAIMKITILFFIKHDNEDDVSVYLNILCQCNVATHTPFEKCKKINAVTLKASLSFAKAPLEYLH